MLVAQRLHGNTKTGSKGTRRFPETDVADTKEGEKVLYDLVLQHVQLVTGYIYNHQDHFRMVMEQQLHTESEKQIKAIYVDAPDKSSGKRRQHIHIQYDGLGFIPLNELLAQEKA